VKAGIVRYRNGAYRQWIYVPFSANGAGKNPILFFPSVQEAETHRKSLIASGFPTVRRANAVYFDFDIHGNIAPKVVHCLSGRLRPGGVP
jgi:hypothetical protein